MPDSDKTNSQQVEAPSSLDRNHAPRLTAFIPVCFVVGLLLRAATLWVMPPEVTGGDQLWYLNVAHNIAAHGEFKYTAEPGEGFQFARPPLYPMMLAALFKVTGLDSMERILSHLWLVIGFSALWGTLGILLVPAIARQVFPKLAWLPYAATALTALNINEILLTRRVGVEPLVIPLTLGFVYVCLKLAAEGQKKWAVAAVVYGTALVHLRIDLIALAVTGVVGGYILSRNLGRSRARKELQWGVVGAVILAMCAPWSAFVSAQTGQPTFMSRAQMIAASVESGFALWVTSISVDPQQYARLMFGFRHGAVDPAYLPSTVFKSAEEESTVRALFETVRQAGHLAPEIDRKFAELASDRISSSPIRYYFWLPIERSLWLWVSYSKGQNQAGDSTSLFSELTPKRIAFAIWCLPFTILTAAGFILSFMWAPFYRSMPAFIAWAVLSRTYSLICAGVLVGVSTYETRYITNVHPLAMLLALGSVPSAIMLVKRLRKRKSADGNVVDPSAI